MKKISLLLMLLTIAVVASAAGPFKANLRQLPQKKAQIKKENVLSQREVQQAKKDLMQFKADRVITNQPEGTAYDYQASGRADYAYGGYVNTDNISGKVRIVYADDGTVYLRNLLFHSGDFFGENWVQGTIEGNVLTIPLGQSIYWSDQYQADVVLTWGEVVCVNEDTYSFDFIPDESVTEVKYIIGEDGSLTMQDGIEPSTDQPWELEAYMGTGLGICWSDDDSWGGICNFSHVLSNPVEPVVVPNVIYDQPEGDYGVYMRSGACVYNTYPGYGTPGVCKQTGKMYVVTNAEAGKAYIQKPSFWHDFASGWVEGTYDATTGIISIPVGQYIFYNERQEYGIQMMWGSTSAYQDIDPNTGEPVYYLATEIDEDVNEIQFQIVDDHIYLLGSEGDMDAEYPDNLNATGVYWHFTDDLHMTALEFNTTGQFFNLVPAVPADPADPEWHDSGNENGGSHFEFIPSLTDVDGNPLDPESLSFSFYTDDDQLFTFEASTYYYDLRWDMTEIPFEVFAEGYDFFGGYELTTYGAYFYRTNAEGYDPFFTNRIGVQAIYSVNLPDNDGQPIVNKSNIVYYELSNASSIEDVKADINNNAPIYNVMGQKMNANNLPAGIYIKNGRKFIVK